MWSPRVVWPHPFPSGSIEAVVSPQDPAHTAKTDGYAIKLGNVVPDYFSTAFQLLA
jgi:hypothetical protein